MIVGDGFSSIKDLINSYNTKRLQKPNWKRQKMIVLDDDALACLRKEQLGPDSIVAVGQKVLLRQIGSDRWGSDKDSVTDIIHPDNVDLAIQVASFLGLTVCGLDLMSIDITRPWHENGAVINEVNFKPFFGGDLKNDKAHSYLQSMLKHKGRIPRHVILGNGDLWPNARRIAESLAKSNACVMITGGSHTELSSGNDYHIASIGLFNRCKALLQNRMINALVVVVDSDEFSLKGLPFDEVSELHFAGEVFESMQNIQKMLSGALKIKTDRASD